MKPKLITGHTPDYLNAIELLYPGEVPAIMDLAQTIPANLVQSDYDKFDCKLLEELHYSRISAWNSGLQWGMDAYYSVRDSRADTVGFVSKRFAGRGKKLTIVSLFGESLAFIHWRGRITNIIKNNRQFAQIDRLSSRKFVVTGFDGSMISILDPFWSWNNTQCLNEKTVIHVPTCWPDIGRIDAKNIDVIRHLPENIRDLIVFTLLWKNTPQGMFE